MALSKIDVANMLTGEVPNDNVANLPPSKLEDNINFRNIIINGDMSISQRGTSFSSLGNGDSAYTLDRFKFTEEGDFGSAEITVSQDTTVPSGQGFAKSLKCVCATADTSVDSGTISYIEQRIEGQNLQYLKKGTSNAEALTLSFWCRSNLTGTFTVYVKDEDNSRMFSTSYSLSSADTWEKITINIPADTTGAFTNDNGSSLLINWNLQAGTNKSNGSLASTWQSISEGDRAVGQTNFFSSTSNNWYITGVQLEAGTSASDFEFLPFDINQRRCQRYYYRVNPTNISAAPIGTAIYYSSSAAFTQIPFPITMRASPTLEQVTGTNYFNVNRNADNDFFDAFETSNFGTESTTLYVSSGLSATSGDAGRTRFNNTSARVAFVSEL